MQSSDLFSEADYQGPMTADGTTTQDIEMDDFSQNGAGRRMRLNCETETIPGSHANLELMS